MNENMKAVDVLAVRGALVEEMARANARVLFKHQILLEIERWRTPEKMMASWGATEAECLAAAHQALNYASESPHVSRRVKEAEDRRRKGRCGDCSGENNGRAKGKRRLAELASADGAK